MLLLNYFQKLLPDTPNVVSAFSRWTIQETEDVFKELKKMQDKGKKKKKYCMWTPQQWLEIGEQAAKKLKCQHTSIPVFKVSAFDKAMYYWV